MQRERRKRPADEFRAPSGDNTNTVPQVTDHIAHFQRRVILDALLDAWGGYWERRARQLEAARPMPGDFTGRASREELSAQWRRLTETAEACRARAQVSPLELIEPDVDNVLGESA